MGSTRIAWFLLGLGLALGQGSQLVRAEEGEAAHDPVLPFRDLTVAPTVRLVEGPRMLGDAFPYLAAASRNAPGARAVEIVPETFRSFLNAAPQKGGDVPARIRTGQAAIEAVRLFVAGPLVRTLPDAEALIGAGRRLSARLEHLDVKVTAHRPGTWAPTARPLDQDKSRHPIEAWRVSLVALELDRMLRLVHVTARVTADGEVTLAREAIVDGPMTSWQTASSGEWTEAMQRREETMRAEAVAARRAYARALRPARELDAFWAVGRVLHDMDDVRALFGEPDRDVGSGIHIWVYDLADGTSVVFGGSRERAVYVRHVRGAIRPLRGYQTLGTIYAGPGR